MSTLFTDFYDASMARNIAMGGAAALGVVLAEINYIKTQIDTAAPAGGLSVTITAPATTMTNSTAYYNAWFDPLTYTDDTSVFDRSRMDAVVKYFSALGYRVQRQRNGTNNNFQWVISW